MSNSQRNDFKAINSTKQYQPQFPLEYSQRYGPYNAITKKSDSLAQNFINLLMTNPGEWPMNPDLGIGIRKHLFDQSSANIAQSLRPNIINQLEKYLPHIKLHSINIEQGQDDIDNNHIKIKINCIILNSTFASIIAYLDKLTNLVIDYINVKEFNISNNSLAPRLDSDLISRQVVI